MDDLKTIRHRLVESLVPPAGQSAISRGEAERLMATLSADGRWPDIDYASKQRSQWHPGGHVRNAMELARCYRATGHVLFGKAEVRDKAVSALRRWVADDLQCPNWWWNEIGVPEALGRALLLLGDEAPADLVTGSHKILLRSDIKDMTGQNTLWVCGVRIMRGCIDRSPETVAAAFKRIADEIKVTTGQGVQPDFSFHQHGTLLYSGGYGRGFAVYGPQFARLASGTAFEFPPEKIRILSAYLLDGEQWMIRGQRFDPSATGREITRKGHSATPLAQACGDLAPLDPARRGELDDFARRLRGEAGATPLVGNRHFWQSDFMTHQRPEWYASVRMFSKRLYNSELVNGEGLRSHHLADGLTFIMRTGAEYDDIFPVWDWNRLPGTTCEQGPLPDPVKQRGETTFVGGASDGLYGVAAMDLRRGPLSARKSWFLTDRMLIALGAGIACTSENRVLTSIDQRPVRGPVRVPDSAAARALAGGQAAPASPDWVQHDGFAYFPLAGTRFRVQAARQTGSWRLISEPSSAAPVEMDVLSIWVDHGAHPSGATYAYAVGPAAGDMNPVASPGGPAVEILSNTPDLQAVRDRQASALGVVFWKPGTASVPQGLAVGADKPCIVLVREQPGGLRLAVADPAGANQAVTIQVNRPLVGEGCVRPAEARQSTIIKIALPEGADAGKTIVRDLKNGKP
jgi:chondroitin AC lyase